MKKSRSLGGNNVDVEWEVRSLVKQLAGFQYTLSSLDKVWNICFPGARDRWRHIHVTQYKKDYYIGDVNGDGETLLVTPGKPVQITSGFANHANSLRDDERVGVWKALLPPARRWLSRVQKDWIKAHRLVCEQFPLDYRYGRISHAIVREMLPKFYRLDHAVGISRARKFARLVESGLFLHEHKPDVSAFTAGKYFNYCRIAYLASEAKGEKIDDRLSGREMYVKFADGRHEGLLDIDPESEKEFADWIDGNHPAKTCGGHPWEIKRGGNTTHIDLSVYRLHLPGGEGYKVELRGESIGRLAETIKMFLAIHEAGLPVSISNPEVIRRRILAQDAIGIIPACHWLHRAHQHFDPIDDVHDVIHYSDLGRAKRRVLPFITWKPLPILRPKLK